MNKITATIGGTILLAVGAFAGATMTSNVNAEGEVVLTKLDNKTAKETLPVTTTLNIDELKQEINNLKLSKDSLNLNCDQQVTYYNDKIQAVRAKIDSLKNLGIE